MSSETKNRPNRKKLSEMIVMLSCMTALGVAAFGAGLAFTLDEADYRAKFESTYGVSELSMSGSNRVDFMKDGAWHECVKVPAQEIGKPLTCYTTETLTP